jgi:integrase
MITARKDAGLASFREDMERRPTLGEARDAFLADLAIEGRSPATIRTYRALLKLPTGHIDDLTPELCRRLIGDRLTQSSATARTFTDGLASFCRYLSTMYGIANPLATVPRPRVKLKAHRFLTIPQVRAVWLACPDDRYRLLVLLLLQGLRASEAVNLRREHISGDVAHILGKGSKPRRIVLPAAALALFDDGLGFEYRELYRRVVWLGKQAKIPYRLTPHAFRHTWASQSLIAGLDSEALRSAGGWAATSSIVDRYIRSAREEAALQRSRELGLTEKLLDGGG